MSKLNEDVRLSLKEIKSKVLSRLHDNYINLLYVYLFHSLIKKKDWGRFDIILKKKDFPINLIG